MTPREPPREPLDPQVEDLLWQLAGLADDDDGAASGDEPDRAILERYRGGELPAEAAEALERRLAGDRRARERLAEIAGLEPRAVPGPPAGPPRRALSQPRVGWRLAASIVLAFGMAGALYLGLRAGPEAEAPHAAVVPPYEVEVHGLAERREARPSAVTRLGSTVRIVARPDGPARAGLRFALYRRGEGGVLERVPDHALHLEVERGAAVLEATAGALVGPRPGSYELALLVGPPSRETPATLTHARARELAEEGYRIEIVEIELLAEEPP